MNFDFFMQNLQLALASILPDSFHFTGGTFRNRVIEDPVTFIPQPGRVRWPTGPGVRVDGALAEGGDVSPFYDSMVAKIIVHAATRELAIERMLRALDETVIEGIGTNLPLQRRILDSDAFRTGQVDVHWLEEQLLADHRS